MGIQSNFHGEIPADVHPEPLLAQFEAVFPCPVVVPWCHILQVLEEVGKSHFRIIPSQPIVRLESRLEHVLGLAISNTCINIPGGGAANIEQQICRWSRAGGDGSSFAIQNEPDKHRSTREK